MPTSKPVVNGIDNLPASVRVANRTAGSLSGLPKWARPLVSKSLREVVSSIMPMDGATGLSLDNSDQVITPGLRCGSRPVSSSTLMAAART